MNKSLPFITVVMPVKNESSFIKEAVDQLLVQKYPKDRYEIIVADGLSTDNTRDIVKEISKDYPNVKLHNNPDQLSSAGRNIGFKNGVGEYFVVVDGHCIIDDQHFLNNIAESFLKSSAACLGRPQPVILPEEPSMQRAIALARSSKIGHSSNSFIHSDKEAFVSPVSVGCAYTKDVFDKVGYLDETFDACEDVDFNYRVEKAGLKAFFSPRIAVKYYPRESLNALYRQLIRYGVGRAKFIFKHPENFNFDMMVPLVFLGGMVFGPLLGLISHYFIFIYGTVVILYILLLLTVSCKLRGEFGPRFIMKIFLAFIVVHFTLGFGLLKGIIIRLIRGRA